MGAYYNDGPFTAVSGEALVADRLVKLSTTTVIYADAGDEPVGIVTDPVATATPVSVRPLTGGIQKVTGAGVIAAGAAIYCAADGKVSTTAVGTQLGVMMTAISADGGKGAAIVWGPRGGSDQLSARGGACELFDDFFIFDDEDDWIDTVSDAGTIDVIDEVNGVLSIASGATAQNESYVSSIHEVFKFLTTKRLFFEARVKLTEANVNDANIIVGLSDTVAANSLLDAGAGPMASYDGACFFKVFDGVVWQFETSNAAVQVTTANAGAFATATWYKLGFLYDYNDGVTAKVTPFLDGVAGTVHDLTIAGLEEMHVLLGVKAGGANAETLLVDYVHVVAER